MTEAHAARDTQSRADDRQQPNENWAIDCAQHFGFAAIQKPVTALAQAVDHVSGTSLEQATQFMEAPVSAEFGSARWHAEQVASGVGAVVPFIGAMAITRPVASRLLETPMITMSAAPASTVLARYSLAEATAAGFVQGAVFEPSHGQDDFIGQRVRQGVVSGATMASLHGMSRVLTGYTGTGIVSNVFNAGVSGAGAGAVSTVADSVVNNHTFTAKDLVTSSYSMAFTGAAMSAGTGNFMRLHQEKSSLPAIEEFVARRFDGKSSGDHYITWLQKQTPMERAGLALTHMQDKLGLRSKKTAPEAQKTDASSDAAPASRHKFQIGLSDFSALDRVQLIGRLQKLSNNPLVNERSITSFVDGFTKATENWKNDNLPELQRRYEAGQKEVDSRFEASLRLQDEHRNNRTEVRTRTDDGGFHTTWRDHPSVIEAVERSKAAVAERDATYKQLVDARNARTQTIEKAVNEFLRANNLPEITVQSSESLPGDAGYGNGTLRIRGKVMDSPAVTGGQIGLTFHELIHLTQDYLRLRMYADELGVGKHPTELDIVQLRYRALRDFLEKNPQDRGNPEINDALTDQFLQSVLKTRDGVRLTPDELKAAKAIEYATDNYHEHPWDADAKKTRTQSSNLFNTANNLHHFDVYSILQTALYQPDKLLSDFGFKRVPRELVRLAQDANVEPPVTLKQSSADLGILHALRDSKKGQPDLKPGRKDLDTKPSTRLGDGKVTFGPDAKPQSVPGKRGDVSDKAAPNAAGKLQQVSILNDEPVFNVSGDGVLIESKPRLSPRPGLEDSVVLRVKEIMDAQVKVLDKKVTRFGSRDYGWYMDNLLERQAYPAGILAFLYAQSRENAQAGQR